MKSYKLKNTLRITLNILILFSFLSNSLAAQDNQLISKVQLMEYVQELNYNLKNNLYLLETLKRVDPPKAKELESFYTKYPETKNLKFPVATFEDNQLVYNINGIKLFISFYQNQDVIISIKGKKFLIIPGMTIDEIEKNITNLMGKESETFVNLIFENAYAVIDPGTAFAVTYLVIASYYLWENRPWKPDTVLKYNAWVECNQPVEIVGNKPLPIINNIKELQSLIDIHNNLVDLPISSNTEDLIKCLAKKIENIYVFPISQTKKATLDPKSKKIFLVDSTPEEFIKECLIPVKATKPPEQVIESTPLKTKQLWKGEFPQNMSLENVESQLKINIGENEAIESLVKKFGSKPLGSSSCKNTISQLRFTGLRKIKNIRKESDWIQNGGICVARYGILRSNPCKDIDFKKTYREYEVSDPDTIMNTYSAIINYDCKLDFPVTKTFNKTEDQFSFDKCAALNSCIEKSTNDEDWLIKNSEALRIQGKKVCKSEKLNFHTGKALINEEGRTSLKKSLKPSDTTIKPGTINPNGAVPK